MDRAVQAKAGTTVMIQAAPGAGKTALLTECARLARARRWQIAEIDPDGLYNPAELSSALRLPLPPKRQEATKGGNLQFLHGTFTSEYHLPGSLDILKSGRAPLLLLMDEAQRLMTTIPPSPHQYFINATKFLNAIHNGKIKDRPVILLAAGLGATAQAFKRLKISRFDPDCKINLGMLKKETTRAVLRNWIEKDGRAKGDTDPWIDVIAEATHGWPQHIMTYVWAALRQLEAADGKMTSEGLKTVMEEGRKGRTGSYEARVEEFESQELRCIARAVADVKPGERIRKEDIVDSLLHEFSRDKVEEVFTLALHKGMLDKWKNDYVIPIPSMHEWLISSYACI